MGEVLCLSFVVLTAGATESSFPKIGYAGHVVGKYLVDSVFFVEQFCLKATIHVLVAAAGRQNAIRGTLTCKLARTSYNRKQL